MNPTPAVLSLLLATAVAGSVTAHVAIPADFREIVHESALIVRGRVTDVRSISVPSIGERHSLQRPMIWHCGPDLTLRFMSGRG